LYSSTGGQTEEPTVSPVEQQQLRLAIINEAHEFAQTAPLGACARAQKQADFFAGSIHPLRNGS
jgi:hypothetical protein